MPTVEGLRIRFRNDIFIPLTCHIRRKKLTNCEFTIISNNCWGGVVYDAYNLKKQSPTVGMFFMADDYIKFCKDIKYYLGQEMEFIKPEESKYVKKLSANKNWGSYPIARLGDVELHLLHYHGTEDEIRAKWTRRIKRIHWDRLLIKYNDQNGCTEDNLRDFLDLPYSNKIFFTCKDWNIADSRIVKIHQFKEKRNVLASLEPFDKCKEVDIPYLLNNLK